MKDPYTVLNRCGKLITDLGFSQMGQRFWYKTRTILTDPFRLCQKRIEWASLPAERVVYW